MILNLFSSTLSKHAQPRFIRIIPLPSRYPPSSRLLSKASGFLPSSPSFNSINTPEDKVLARSWIAEFKKHAIPKRLVEFTFARSSGPGGQNVNKVNTKAILRCSVTASWIPSWAREELRRSTYYVLSTDEILIASTIHRSQAQNIEECLSQLHSLLLSASSTPIKKDPTIPQQEKVKRLERAERRARRTGKDYRSNVKQGRRTKSWD